MLATSAPIARLRSLGCRVSHLLGHWPNVGENGYIVTLPDGIPTGHQYVHGNARLQARPTEHRVIISTPGYRGPASIERRQYAQAAQIDAAAVLNMFADHVETFDRESSASRQHFIDTGRYLTRVETNEAARSFPVVRHLSLDSACLDFEHNNLGPRKVVELISYLLTLPGRQVADLPDLYEGAARTLIALGILNPDGSLGQSGADYLDSLEG